MKKQNNGLIPLYDEEAALPIDQEVNLAPETNTWTEGDAVITSNGDDIEVSFGDDDDEINPFAEEDMNAHDANLAEFLDEKYQDEIANTCIDEVEIDKKSREGWNEVYRAGIEAVGVLDEKGRVAPFKGASTVTYPMLSTAIIQFQARAISEIFPPAGPVKTRIIGKETEERRQQNERVKDHMNYQVTEEDEGFFDELDQLLFFLPIGGSAFKKVYWDNRADTCVSKFVRPDELIVPYAATSLQTASRYTHQLLISSNDMKIKMNDGDYRTIELIKPSSEKGGEYTTIDSTNDKADSKTQEYEDDDYRHTVYESHKLLDLKGFEHTNEAGEKTGIALPYVVTIDFESKKVLAITRNWKEGDNRFKKRVWFVHYKYLPGVGFYGFGLLHIIGGLQRAANGTMRVLLDSGAFASLQGGFKSKDSRVKSGDMTITPGEWKDINLTSEELSKAFYTPPYKEPSQALFNLLELIIDAAQRVTSTTEAMVGDASNTGPVGTTLALIEQGSKVYSGIHKRLHNAGKQEFRLRASLNSENLDQEQPYPYETTGDSKLIQGSDYDGRVDVLPFSDPNIFSSTQRIAKAQSISQLAAGAPELYNMHKVHKRMLEAMEVNDIDELLPDPSHSECLDPITENQMMLVSKPIKTKQDQNHAAHIAVHMAFLNHPQFGMNPAIREIIMGPMVQHLAEHKGYEYRDMMKQAGAVTLPLDVAGAQKGADLMNGDADPQQEYMISIAQAQAIAGFMQMQGSDVSSGGDQQQDPAAAQAQADAAAKEADTQTKVENHQMDQKMKSDSFASEQNRADEKLAREETRKDDQTRAQLARDHVTNKVEAAKDAANNKSKDSK